MDKVILSYSGGRIVAGGKKETRLAEGVELLLCKGKSLALIGETGSGKTMTALSVMGLLPAGVKQHDADIQLFGEKIPSGREMRRILGVKIVYIPQNGAESLDPSRTVRKQMRDDLRKLQSEKGAGRVSSASLDKIALEKLALAGFEHPEEVIDKYPFQLSGGMAQRVTVALAACSEAELIIADEPANGLDDDFAEDFLKLIRKVFPDAAILMITHDISMAAQCDDIVVLCGGRMMEKGPSADVLTDPQNPYTKALIKALPANGLEQTPVLRQGDSDCPFFSRCPEASEKCTGPVPWQQSGRARRCVL